MRGTALGASVVVPTDVRLGPAPATLGLGILLDIKPRSAKTTKEKSHPISSQMG
jgi:hypothetical protein